MVDKILKQHNDFFRTGATKNLDFRLQKLRELQEGINRFESEIVKALGKDLGRPATESYTSEIFIVLQELKLAIKKLKKWAKPVRVKTPLLLQPGRSFTIDEPYGVVLIIGPWNYPFQLLITPLIGAIAAGNCAVIKPSEFAPNTARVIADLIADVARQEHARTVLGGVETAQSLLDKNFDYIFFTGGTSVGRKIMKSAAANLTPVTLELGGKCPCIVHEDADIETAARRITWGKFFNAGQTCMAPDYVYAHRQIKGVLVSEIKNCIEDFYGDDPSESPDYGRIVNEKHFDRLLSLFDLKKDISMAYNRETRFIAPTVLDDISIDDKIMQEEIFGPILPVLEFGETSDVVSAVNIPAKPLHIYLFTKSRSAMNQVIQSTSSGGVTINDVLIQSASSRLPFGGVGESGMGRYRGKSSFETFSNQKSIMKRWNCPDWSLRYPPYKKGLNFLRKFFT